MPPGRADQYAWPGKQRGRNKGVGSRFGAPGSVFWLLVATRDGTAANQMPPRASPGQRLSFQTFLAPAETEGVAAGNFEHQGGELILFPAQRRHDSVHGRRVVVVQAAA